MLKIQFNKGFFENLFNYWGAQKKRQLNKPVNFLRNQRVNTYTLRYICDYICAY